MRPPDLRAALSFGLVAAWLGLLLSGVAWGGAVHLLLGGALVTFPWKAARG